MPRLDSGFRPRGGRLVPTLFPLLSPKMKEVGGNGGVTHRLPLRNYSNTRLNVPATVGRRGGGIGRKNFSSIFELHTVLHHRVYIQNCCYNAPRLKQGAREHYTGDIGRQKLGHFIHTPLTSCS